MRPLIAYTMFRDLNFGDFVFMRLHDLNLVLVRMGKTECLDVVKDVESKIFKMVKVQWWVLMKK